MSYYSKLELQKIYKRVDLKKFFDHYKARIDSQFGDELRMCCVLPGHKDSSPSASFNTRKGIYNCFVCGGKNFFSLVQELEGLKSFGDGVEFVKKMVGYGDNEDAGVIEGLIDELNDIRNEDETESERPIYTEIDFSAHPEFEPAFTHFSRVKKRVSKQMIDHWDLRYVTSGYYRDRLVVPITLKGKVMSFAARDMSGKANRWNRILKQAKKDRLTVTELAELKSKYECKKILYPPMVDKLEGLVRPTNMIFGTAIKFLMFNFDNVIRTAEDHVILVEGVFDCMRLSCWGYPSVALCGTKLSSRNRELLLGRFDKIYVALDNDVGGAKNAGQYAAQSIIDSLGDEIDVYNVILPPNKDPDECTFAEFEQCLKCSMKNEIVF